MNSPMNPLNWSYRTLYFLGAIACFGAIGYALQQNLQNILYQRGIKKKVVTVITQTLVDRNDPAFSHPTKPIGGFMSKEEAERRQREQGWSVVEDAGRGWRRVVASPLPNCLA